MVIVRLGGGLGNQLYQYAVGRMLACRLNTELKLDLSVAKISFKADRHDRYRLGDFNVQENFATPEEIARVRKTGIIPPPFPRLENVQGDILIKDNWMHGEEFFLAIAYIIRRRKFRRTARSSRRLSQRRARSHYRRIAACLLSDLCRGVEKNFPEHNGVCFLGRFELGAEKFATRRAD